METMAWAALGLLCVFYGAYLLKMADQRRQGITTNVMVRGQKSRRAHWVGGALMAVNYCACAVQFLSCFRREHLWPLAVPAPLAGLGLILMAAGTGLFIAAFLTMKSSWRAGIDESQKTVLVTEGLYRLSRNPAFVGFDLLYLGSALAVGNAVLLAAACAVVVVIHLQILEEEKHLEKMFGQSYVTYKNRCADTCKSRKRTERGTAKRSRRNIHRQARRGDRAGRSENEIVPTDEKRRQPCRIKSILSPWAALRTWSTASR